jgi:hypothetical protein
MKIQILQGATSATFNEQEGTPLFDFKEISSEEGVVHLTYTTREKRDMAKQELKNSRFTCGEMRHNNGWVVFINQADLIVTR